ncbi:chromosome segregation protein SMC [Desulforegula conservatrix]|uniref:chromosome segregation protein SMC n=1 Tax=Desulforegula conservatrix TaxID=153026 RepID=UPI0003FDFD80|nr:chromosome segregation protein SMC [Desulforegula conservatrix]
MKIKTLEICGFKSFPEKTVINFPKGISAIVGPNGCGKSNVIDAMRWIMGEQNVRNLRGRTSEDIIFAGTEAKQQLNMAEVSVTLINDDGRLPDVYNDYSEIMITRRLYRSGESEYKINRHPCRLKDIHDIFMGSGAGKKSFAVIQQGNIGAITDASPEERRFFVEEAAGVTKYKARKDETLKKIDATNENLLRVEDIISEVKRQMDSLSAQAKKAERFKEYQKEIKKLELAISAVKYSELNDNSNLINEKLTILRNTELIINSQISETGAGLAKEKLELDLSDETIARLTSERYEKLRLTDQAESELKHCNAEKTRLEKEIEDTGSRIEKSNEEARSMDDEITQAASELEILEKQIKELEEKKLQAESSSVRLKKAVSRLERLGSEMNRKYTETVAFHARISSSMKSSEGALESIKSRLRRLDEEAEASKKNLKEFETSKRTADEDLEGILCDMRDSAEDMSKAQKRLSESNSALEAATSALKDSEFRQKGLLSELGTLKKMDESMTGFGEGLKMLCRDPNVSDSLSVFADQFIIEAGYERAVEAALGESALFLYANEQETVFEALKLLKDKKAGRCGFILHSNHLIPATKTNLKDHAREILEFVRPLPGFEITVDALLANIFLVEDIYSIKSIPENLLANSTIVTQAGDVVKNGFLFSGGSDEGNSGIFEKKNRIRFLEHGILEGTSELEALEIKVSEAKNHIESARKNLAEVTETHNACIHDKQEVERKIFQIEESIKHARKRSEIVILEQDQLSGELEDMEIKVSKDKKQFLEAEKNIDLIKIILEKIRIKTDQIRQKTESSSGSLSEIIGAFSGAKSRYSGAKSQLERLVKFRDDSKSRLEQMLTQIAEKKADLDKTELRAEETRKSIHLLGETLAELSESLEQSREANNSIKERVKELISRHDGLQKKNDLIKDEIRNSESDKSQMDIQMQAIETRISEKYHIPMSECLENFKSISDLISVQDMEQSLAAFKKRIAALGEVNMTAIREYEELKERFDFLTTQKDDLVATIEDLQSIIRKINRITQEKFIETFEQINLKLKEVFPLLFGGGKAELIMTDPSKPLETGVELMIHPPGKKLSRLSLLSGGEKALSAIAFIFSVFMIKPASFCIMDEIDAPLDEANVIRFNELVKVIGKNSQILVITHNKKTMEFADVLFGVTMEKKGVSKVVSVDFTRGEVVKNGV